jgi:hypothetical protein
LLSQSGSKKKAQKTRVTTYPPMAEAAPIKNVSTIGTQKEKKAQK